MVALLFAIIYVLYRLYYLRPVSPPPNQSVNIPACDPSPRNVKHVQPTYADWISSTISFCWHSLMMTFVCEFLLMRSLFFAKWLFSTVSVKEPHSTSNAKCTQYERKRGRGNFQHVGRMKPAVPMTSFPTLCIHYYPTLWLQTDGRGVMRRKVRPGKGPSQCCTLPNLISPWFSR